jgi:uncharacterized cupin superfamily protein
VPTPVLIHADENGAFDFGGLGVCWKIDGHHTQDRFSIVHHPIAPRALAAPLHRHDREDELSFVLTGELGALLGDRGTSGIRSGTPATRPARSSS